MPIDFSKIDRNLLIGYRAWEESGQPIDAAVTVNIHFTGDLAPIRSAGFLPERELEGLATGVIRFADLAALTELDAVEFLAVGNERELDLDSALFDIRARATTSATVGVDGLWHADPSTGTLTGAPSDTGEGVIVAVIDTGIDFTHPHFMSQVSPTKVSRILRIWDQGLPPTAVSDCPDPALLVSNQSYGIEYDKAEIETHLNGGTPILHKDCEGHGTHCVSIAAGGTVFDAGGNARVAGAAPKADIIAVKLLDTPLTINYFTAAGAGSAVGFERRFQDAIVYCLRVAKSLSKPIVVSISLGSPFEPGDGLDDSGRFVDDLINPAAAPSDDHFPKGAVICKSAGNNARPKARSIARIVIPASGEVIVPINLDDRRGGTNNKFKRCANTLHSPAMLGTFWYRRTTPHTAIEFAIKMAGRTAFSGDMGVGGHLEHKFVTRPAGSSMTSHIVPAATPNTFQINALHSGNASVLHPFGGTIRRHNFSVWITPKVVGGTIEYPAGIYEVRIRAPQGTEIFFSGRLSGWAPGKAVLFTVATTMADGTALPAPPDLEVTSEFSTTDPLGQHALTIGAYDDANGSSAAATFHHIAKFSSRGPLRDFRTPIVGMTPLWQKPDITAPGVDIKAALSVDSHRAPTVRLPSWHRGNRWVELGGTSMSTPMVAGVVALMLAKKNDLNINDVRTVLMPPKSNPPVDPPPGPAGRKAYGVGRIDALNSHKTVP